MASNFIIFFKKKFCTLLTMNKILIFIKRICKILIYFLFAFLYLLRDDPVAINLS